MKAVVTRFKSLTVALKELEPFIRNGVHLQTGKPFKKMGDLRSREILANWLICAVMNFEGLGEFDFSTDPDGGDGLIIDVRAETTFPTEHVMLPSLKVGDNHPLEDRILEKIRFKVDKGGEAYARGKTLVVFLNAGAGPWYPNRVARSLPDPLHFDTVWIVSLQEVRDGQYVYGVTNLQPVGGHAPAYRVTISADFSSWKVERIQ